MDEISKGSVGPDSYWASPPGGAPGYPSTSAVPGETLLSLGAADVLADSTLAGRVPRRRGAVVASLAAVSVVVVAGGAFAAYTVLSGGGAQPEDVLPANTLALVKVDLDPSAGQKIALFQLLQKFPNAVGLKDSDQTFADWLSRRFAESAGSASVNFDRDVKPWLGQRFAVADVPDSTGKNGAPLLVLQETDDQAAAAGLDRIRSAGGATSFDYAFADGYVVISPGAADAAHQAVAATAQTGTLADSVGFAEDVNALGSDEIVTAWADASKVGQQVKQFLEQ